MTGKKLLTDRYLRARPPAPSGKPIEVWDSAVRGFGIRITDVADANPARRGKCGKIVFLLYARFASGASPTRRTIGTYGAIKLEEARRIAGEWRSLIDKGVDPAMIEAERQAAEARERAQRIQHSFANVAETFITDKLAKERRGKDAERDLRANFIAAWGDRPISEITKLDVLAIVNAKKRAAPDMARTLLVLIKRFFNWVVDQEIYGLDQSPCDRLKVSKIIGEMTPRSRRLNDVELFAFWRAAGRMKYPAGPAYQLLVLAGLRLNEAARLSWPEIHGDHIIIPASRMKGRNGKAREHLVPLSATAQEIIASLPRFKNAPFLFSLSAGKHPLTISDQIKRDLDRRMLRTLKAMARRRGEDHHAVTLPHWVNHDLRRVIRSGLSALGVAPNVCEAILAHKPVGVVAVYNVYEFQAEKREALERWARQIKAIVEPAADNVIALRGRQR